MGKYVIMGGQRLCGEARVHGGKNAILPILASVILNRGVSVIHDCPAISDTFLSAKILESLGCKTNFSGNTFVADSSNAGGAALPEKWVSEMRSSIIFLGGILGRFGQASIGSPGGCTIGRRPIDYHIAAFRKMGADIEEAGGSIVAKPSRLHGEKLSLDFPSVGATENIMLAGTLAKGTTIIQNAAKEPEIIDLQNFLVAMGAKISGAGTSTVVIEGVTELHDAEFTVMPDRIVAGTLMTAAAATGGSLTLLNVQPEHLTAVSAKLVETGCKIREWKNEIHIQGPKIIKAVGYVKTMPHPGFPTDMQSQMLSYLSAARGTSVVIETVFESRNKHAAELAKMGAKVYSDDGKTFVVRGVHRLRGATVDAPDLRSGAALIIAGLAAEGETVVRNSKYIERGYERIEKTLSELGARVRHML